MSSRLSLVLTAAAIGGWLAGCGTTGAPPRTTTAASALARATDPVKPAPAPPHLVKASPTAYGVALMDRRGFALYRFTHDTGPSSTCYGACATAWPPYLVPRGLKRGSGDGGLVGTIRRANGRLQVTYARHPLYYYVGDRRPGQVLCQGVTEFGGVWDVVAPDGHLIR